MLQRSLKDSGLVVRLRKRQWFALAGFLGLLAVLTDRGREFCGRPERHPYELFLELNDIEHRLCKVATPRTNGFVERFHRTALDKFFRLAFRKKLYLTVEELQKGLDAWLKYYNEERPRPAYLTRAKCPVSW